MEEVVSEDQSAEKALEVVFLVIMLVGTAMNVYLMWDFIKERPEWAITQRRLAQWWHKVVVAPEKRATDIRRAEKETVFQAIQIVDGEA